MSAGQVYDRWFITPPAEDERGTRYPKYMDTDGIAAYVGTLFPTSVIENGGYHGLLAEYPQYDEWYIVRMYGDGNPGWNALNQLHNHRDTRTLTDHQSDVAPIMNNRFGVDEWSFNAVVNR